MLLEVSSVFSKGQIEGASRGSRRSQGASRGTSGSKEKLFLEFPAVPWVPLGPPGIYKEFPKGLLGNSL